MYWPKQDADHLIVTASQMTCIENEILSIGLPVEALMEKVGYKISKWLLKRNQLLKKGVVVLVGPGHNGGDGLVIARELHLSGINVSIWCPFPLQRSLTKKHYSYAKWLDIKELVNPPDISGEELWIEALFGLAQTRQLSKEISDLFNSREKIRPRKLISIDVPAGISSDTGKTLGTGAAKAFLTLTVGLFKRGLIQDDALPYVGHLERIDIGLSQKTLKQSINTFSLRIVAADIDTFTWPKLPKEATKYERGRLLIVAGSEKYRGAGLLSIKGALASGAGSIQAALPGQVSETLWQCSPEVILTDSLENSSNNSSVISKFFLKQNLERIDSLLIGPGLGISDDEDEDPWTQVSEKLERFVGLLVLDADALNRIASSSEGWKWFKKRKGPTLITPHKKEFKRLFVGFDCSCSLNVAIEAARASGVGVLLKGAHSVLASPEGNSWQLGESAPWVSRTGLGDVLAGFMAGVGSIGMASKNQIDWELFAVSALIHADTALRCKRGSNASLVSESLSEKIRDINFAQCLERDI